MTRTYPPLDGLIVLGARLNPVGRPGRVARLRLIHALELWQQHYLDKYLLLSGGVSGGARFSEAKAMADWSLNWLELHFCRQIRSQLKRRLILEEESPNTAAAAQNTLRLVQRRISRPWAW